MNKPVSIAAIRTSFRGEVIGPGDAGYDAARTVFMGGIDRKPAVIIRPLDAPEVAQVIRLAGETGLPLAVRGGGHSSAGHGVVEGGIVLDLSPLNAMDVDVNAKHAWAQAGLTARNYSQIAAKHGLATGFGDTGSVGIGGITLGGGIGYLVRKYGLTIDDVLGAELVTADGTILLVDTEKHPDLFWAIRGGGGNFGVVTKFRYRLHAVRDILGGMLVLPATAETVSSFIDYAAGAPDELSTIVNVMTAPPMPFLAKEYVGTPIIMALMCYAGPFTDGDKIMSRFRSITKPLADMVKIMPYPAIYPPDQEGYHPLAAGRTMFIDTVSKEVAAMILDHILTSKASMSVAQLRVLGGAVGRIAPDATAFAHRRSKIMTNLAALYQKPEEKPVHEAWVSGFANQLLQSDTGAYVNFIGDEGESRVRAAYPGKTWDRLRKIKSQYDPENLFRLNQNITPAAL